MTGTAVLSILTFFHTIHIGLCVFYHESSRVSAKPMHSAPKSDFGFSLGYKDDALSTLVVGAPRYNSIGMVYTCPAQEILNGVNIACSEVHIDVDSMVNYTREISPNQKFYLGSSIAATPDYFLTCAPLLITTVTKNTGKKLTDASGTCFVYDDIAHRYEGTLERYVKRKKIKDLSLFQGGVGWNTLIDNKNNLTLISKTSLAGDIVYVGVSNPLTQSKSLINEMQTPRSKNWLQKQVKLKRNFGYGLAAGNFFSNSTVYAFSMTTDSMSGEIAFLEYVPKSKTLTVLTNNKFKPQLVENEKYGSIFGYAMDATDINLDGYSELLVGAPAFYDDEKFEYGAVHIYIGGSLDLINDKSKMRTIIGTKREARFGSAIATQDIDEDGIPEIFISAPYEDSGMGAVYVLSGFEVNKILLGYAVFKQVQVTDLKLTQRIQVEGQRNFGFSLQIIRDVDQNGCDELSVGAPGTESVWIYRCLSAINVTVTTKLIGAQNVREQDNNFTVAVCVNIGYNSIPEVAANLTVTNDIVGAGAHIPKSEFAISLSDMQPSYCNNVTVLLNNNDPGDYKFKAKVNLNYSEIENSKNFNSSWVTLSPYSKTKQIMVIPRHCKGDDCKSNLSMNIAWSGKTEYLLGSSEMETVTVRIRNDGHNAYDACMLVRVSGAQVSLIGCPNDDIGYKCSLPNPLRRNTEHTLDIVLNMTQSTSVDDKLAVAVQLYESCHEPNVIKQELVVNYLLDPSQISLKGLTVDRNVTDSEIMDADLTTINDGHEYWIINNGSVMWEDVSVVITMEKKAFIQSYSGSSTESDRCIEEDKDDSISFTCNVVLMPNSTKKFIAAMEIAKDKISDNLINGKLNTTSSISVHLKRMYDIQSESLMTMITYQQELSFGNNRSLIILIATIVAIIILAIVIFILYRLNFFKRKQKNKLAVLRESVRRKSIKRNESTADNDSAKVSDGVECIELEVIDDSPFEENPTPTQCDDGVVLIKDKAQVHC